MEHLNKIPSLYRSTGCNRRATDKTVWEIMVILTNSQFDG